MATVVLDSKDLVKSLETGEIPVPAEVAADRVRTHGEPAPAAADTAVVAAAQEGKPPEKPKREDFSSQAEFDKAVHESKKPRREDFDSDEAFADQMLEWGESGKLTDGMRKQMTKLRQQRRDAEEFAAHMDSQRRLSDARVAKLEAELEDLRQKAAPAEKPAAEPAKPARAQFQTDEAFQDALVEFRVKEQLAKERREAQEAAQKAEAAKQLEVAQARITRAVEIVPDFKEVIEATDQQVPQVVAGYMQESELFPELLYHLAKNPQEAQRLAKLSTARALVEIGKIESKLQPFAAGASPAPAAKVDEKAAPKAADGAKPDTTGKAPDQTRQAAPVITPLNSGSGTQVEKAEGEMSTREAIASWARKNRSNLGARKRH